MDKLNNYSKSYRLRKRSDFLQLRSSSFIFKTKYYRIFCRPFSAVDSVEETNMRLGISVPKKVGPSPKRNRLKRIVREAFRQWEFKSRSRLDIHLVFLKSRFPDDYSNKIPESEIFHSFKGLEDFLIRKNLIQVTPVKKCS